MLELPALDFVAVVAEVRRLITLLDQNVVDAETAVPQEMRTRMAGTVGSMREHLATIAAQSAWVAANRFHGYLENPEQALNFADVKQNFRDIESRFADHLSFIKLFVVRPEQLSLLGTAAELLGEPAANRFTSLWFDCEEAAKCLLVLRPTAAVFHAMRMLEIGIRAFATRLDIPDPVTPAQRNWAIILREIKSAIDKTYPASSRTAGSEGAFLEGLHATLDTVKNPWRNEVMHVEGVYTDTEARFIVMCTLAFIQKMSGSFDENGEPVEPSPELLDG